MMDEDIVRTSMETWRLTKFMATTHSAQSVIATAETLFEGFIADNYKFLNLTECIEWCDKVIKPFVKEEETVDEFIQWKSVDDVLIRLEKHIIDKQDDDEEILTNYLSSFTDDELKVLYYKNNLLEFIGDHQEIQSLILDIFENVENLDYVNEKDENWFQKIPAEFQQDFVGKAAKDWNKFVNIQYFMDPNDVPSSILSPITRLKEFLMKYVYCKFLSPDRIYRLRNFTRKVVTVIDTDSNILSLDTSVDYIFDNIIKDQTFNRSYRNNIFICINMLAFVLTEAVTDILLTYGEYSNIPEEFRPIYNMKNEFLFLRLVIGKTKKRYISKIVLREGTLMDPPKYDVKGLNLGPIQSNLYWKHRVNCWELLRA
jgi:hypothetical protein